MPSSMKKIFGDFWIAQIFLIGTLLVYSLIVTSGVVILLETNSLIDNNQKEPISIVTTLIFESDVGESPITWDTFVIEGEINATLYKIMSMNFNLSGDDFGNLGFLITGINGLLNDGINAWTFQYYVLEKGWVDSPVGVSAFILTSSFIIKWNYGSSYNI